MLVRYRGINNKGVLGRPWTKLNFWGPFLVHWDSNLPSNVEKWTFWCHGRPNPAKVRKKSCVCSVRSSRTPLDLPNFNLNYQKTSFCAKLDFSRFTNRSLGKAERTTELSICSSSMPAQKVQCRPSVPQGCSLLQCDIASNSNVHVSKNVRSQGLVVL